jgi:hypothetical protein
MPVRDKDIREAMKEALLATDMFDEVLLTGLPEDYGFGASEASVAAIEPNGSVQADKWDGDPDSDLEVTSTVKITLMARKEDPQIRDDAVELLVDIVANTLNFQSFLGFTVPALTKIQKWTWQKAKHPERRIQIDFKYVYLVPGWNAYDTIE